MQSLWCRDYRQVDSRPHPGVVSPTGFALGSAADRSLGQRVYKASGAHLPSAQATRAQPESEPRAERIERLAPALSPLLQVDGLIVSGLVELCTPHLVHALVVGPAKDHGRAEPNVEVAEIFQSPD